MTWNRNVNKRRAFLILLTLLIMVLACPVRSYAATNVIEKANASATKKGKLVEKKNGIRYQYQNGEYAKNKWLKVKKYYYYFDKDGYAKTGWFKYKGQRYYANKNGKLYVSKWLSYNGKKYYLKNDGTMAAGIWLSKSSKIYRFRSDGSLISGLAYRVNDKIYFADKNGVRVANKWVKVGSEKYYYGKDGVRVTDKWIKTDGKYYYVKSDGKMAVNTAIGKYVVDANGVRHTPGKKYIFVGDSRVVGMEQSCSASNAEYIGKISMGYDWLVSTAASKLDASLKTYPTGKVVMCFGVNDIGNSSKYIAYYKQLVNKYPNAKFYFMSVNPIDPVKYAAYFKNVNVTTSQIVNFNAQLKATFGNAYLDTYTWLTKNGFETRDGIHYTASTYQKIYTYAMTNMN